MGERAPDLIGAGILVALGAAFAMGALTGLEVIDERGRIGPGFMPFTTGLLLVLFGAMVGAGALLWPKTDDAGGDAGEDAGEAEGSGEQGSRYTVAVVFGLTLAAILLIPVLGFLVSFGLLVFAIIRFVEGGSLLLGLGLGVGATVITWAVFVLFLQIPLPGGVFGIGG